MTDEIAGQARNDVLIFFGSPHKDGHTAALLDRFIDALPDGANVHAVNAYDENVRPCIDCKTCHVEDECVYPDCGEIFDYLEKADVLIFATPVYNLSFPAPLKAIIDRMQIYYNKRFVKGIKPPIAKPKKAVLLVTNGDEKNDGAEIMAKQLRMVFTVLNTTLVGVVAVNKTDEEVKGYDFTEIVKTLSM